jgi:hypothetical protein
LGIAAIEAGSLIAPKGSLVYPISILAVSVIGFLLPKPMIGNVAVNPILLSLFMMRTMVAFSAVAGIIATMVWTRRVNPHIIIMLLFCASDASTYLALMRGVEASANAFVMVSQCICIGLWLVISFRYKPQFG